MAIPKYLEDSVKKMDNYALAFEVPDNPPENRVLDFYNAAKDLKGKVQEYFKNIESISKIPNSELISKCAELESEISKLKQENIAQKSKKMIPEIDYKKCKRSLEVCLTRCDELNQKYSDASDRSIEWKKSYLELEFTYKKLSTEIQNTKPVDDSKYKIDNLLKKLSMLKRNIKALQTLQENSTHIKKEKYSLDINRIIEECNLIFKNT